MIIEVSNLVKKYKDVTAVNGVDLKVVEGEIFGLLGPNGAGKSTTISALLGILKINSGTVNIMGKDFYKNTKEIKKNIGYVPQDLAFFEQLSPLDNVTYWGKLYGYRGEELNKAVKDALDFTGLWDRRKDKSQNLSGGMKRRLNIACGIVHKPRILLMDEPTVGVDPQSRNNILESIRTLNKNGMTVIYTSHYMEEIEAICDRVAIMDFGKIIALGTVEELIDAYTKENSIDIELENASNKAEEIILKSEGVISCENEGNIYHVKTKKDVASFSKIVEGLTSNNISIALMVAKKSNLETVFLELTGKQLRE